MWQVKLDITRFVYYIKTIGLRLIRVINIAFMIHFIGIYTEYCLSSEHAHPFFSNIN